MNKFINFKKILFSLFLLSLSFSPVFLMEDEKDNSEPMEQVEIDQPIDQTQKNRKHSRETKLDCLENDIKQLRLDSDTENLEREWSQMELEDAQAQELIMDKIIFNALCNSKALDGVMPWSKNWFNFYQMFKHKIDPNVTELNLAGNLLIGNIELTDVRLRDILQRFPNINCLNLSCCPNITDDGLQALVNCHSLQRLNLFNCSNNITDASLQILSNCPNLQALGLSWCSKITDSGLMVLTKSLNLQSLNLHMCNKITDTGLQIIITNSPNLQYLNLSECTELTDASLQILSNCHNLKTLNLHWCIVTRVGRQRLQEVLPGLKIIE